MTSQFRCASYLSFIALGLAAGAALGADVEVRQSDRLFAPSRIVVGKGSVVYFANDETFVHHAFVDTPQFKADTGDIPSRRAPQYRFHAGGHVHHSLRDPSADEIDRRGHREGMIGEGSRAASPVSVCRNAKQLVALLRAELQRTDVLAAAWPSHAAAVIQRDHAFQRRQRAVMHVGRTLGDVTQGRHLEGVLQRF